MAKEVRTRRPGDRTGAIEHRAAPAPAVRAPKIDVAQMGVNFNHGRSRFALLTGTLAAWLITGCSGAGRPAPIDLGAYWPTHLGNSARAPFLAQRVSQDPPDVVWSAPLGGGIRGGPAVTDHMVVASGTDRYLYALSREDGSEFWSKRLEGPPSPPLLVGNVIYTATEGRGKLRTLRAEDGHDIWKQDFPSVATPMTITNDTLYVASEDGFAYALDTTERGQIWRVRFPQAAVAGPLVVGNWVTHITSDSLYLVARADGHRQAAVPIGDFIAGEPATRGDAIYVTTETGNLKAWSTPDLDALWDASGFDSFLAGPVLAKDEGYAVSRSGELIEFDLGGGGASLIAKIDGTVVASPTVVQNGILVGTLQGDLYFLSRNGERIWEVQLGGSVVQPPLVHEGRILVPMFGAVPGALGSTRQRGKIMELR